MISNKQKLWRATSTLGDHFRRLGGSNCFNGFDESDVFLYVGCRAFDVHLGSSFVAEFVEPRFIDSSKGALPVVDEIISDLSGSQAEVEVLVSEYIQYYNERLQEERPRRWELFMDKCISADSA